MNLSHPCTFFAAVHIMKSCLYAFTSISPIRFPLSLPVYLGVETLQMWMDIQSKGYVDAVRLVLV